MWGTLIRSILKFGPRAWQLISSGRKVSAAAKAAKGAKKVLGAGKGAFKSLAKSKFGRGIAKVGALASAGWVGMEALAGSLTGQIVLGGVGAAAIAAAAYKFKKARDKRKAEERSKAADAAVLEMARANSRQR
jgi:hypothetical protein